MWWKEENKNEKHQKFTIAVHLVYLLLEEGSNIILSLSLCWHG
jgi:hypothetical protein